MSCYLGQFNVLMDEIVREVMEGCVGGGKMSTAQVGIVLFLDDAMSVTERRHAQTSEQD